MEVDSGETVGGPADVEVSVEVKLKGPHIISLIDQKTKPEFGI